MKKMNLVKTIVMILAAALFITGCSGKGEDNSGTAANDASKNSQAENKEAASKPEELQQQALHNEDGSLSISVPANWSELQLNPTADIQAGRLESEDYVMVLSERKDTFSDSLTLQEYYELVTKNMSATIENGVFGDPQSVTVNGQPALQFELRGEIEKIKIGYIITIVETDKSFSQILFWTLQNRMDQKRATYLELADTFKEI